MYFSKDADSIPPPSNHPGSTGAGPRQPMSNPLKLYSESEKSIQGIRSDRVPEELWMEVCDIVQETGIKTLPVEKKMQKSKIAV